MTADKLTEVLESVGMNKSEIKIYVDLVKNKKSSALDISKRTTIHRSNTYDILRNLIEKGFVKESTQNNRKLFIPMEPEKIKDYLRQKEKEIDLIIEHLNQFSEQNNEEETVTITRGQFAAREALVDLMKKNCTINIYGASNEAVQTFGEGFMEEYHKKRARKKILMRHIYNMDAVARIEYLNKLKFTEARALSKKYDTHVSTVICGDLVYIIIFVNPISIITIKNKEIADTYNKYFELLWAKAIIPSAKKTLGKPAEEISEMI
ncbi:MAG: helix-turn-helix domain-containing protein [Candidatus Pacearchaeota archaeon]